MATTDSNNTLFEIPKDGYLAFDALTMKQLIVENLNKTGVFTDQNYQASYLSNVINIIAYSYNALMYYLNKTSTETMFTEAQIYENMNRIVKMLGYNPVGFQTSILPFELAATGLPQGLYVIPRYSYFIKDRIAYSFNEDILFNFTKNSNEIQVLTDINNSKVLYQGRFYEHPLFTATGVENETFLFAVDNNVLVDHFNIFVYVYNTLTNKWEQWTSTENLFLEQPDTPKYEIRISPDQNYEIKFGDNVNGLKLNAGDQIAIYYLQTQGSAGEVSSNFLQSSDYVRFITSQFETIYTDVVDVNAEIIQSTTALKINNLKPSTKSKNGESADQIRSSAPGLFKTQYRLVTNQDYKSFILNNFANFINDVSVANNWEYISDRLKYYYDLGLNKPDLAGAPLYAQVNFADSCNFNNVYLTISPRVSVNTANPTPTLSLSQKQLIINTIDPRKPLTAETVILDPVYIAVDLGVPSTNKTTLQDIDNTQLVITKTPTTRRVNDDIKADIQKVFNETFNSNEIKLGDTINLIDLLGKITSIPGIQQVHTQNITTNVRVPGISLYKFDPVYPSFIESVALQVESKSFQLLFFNNLQALSNRIVFASNSNTVNNLEI